MTSPNRVNKTQPVITQPVFEPEICPHGRPGLPALGGSFVVERVHSPNPSPSSISWLILNDREVLKIDKSWGNDE
jgi:hypothetical protein